MLRHRTYRLIGSLGLLLLFVLPMGVRDAHHLLEAHEAILACDASGNDQHLHGEELKHHDCTLCLIHYAQFLEAEPPAAYTSVPSLLVEEQFEYSFFHNHPSLSHIRERGPPCFALFV
ncbi:MAG: hypothetical protein KDD10_11505 [Phaeodactylibacter sp.]|nr:hypothetical protein [Phaeodactylibacter sp.]MCB9298027.1 hypothetical protein [Lewinellaceae bacterium]